MLRTPLAQAYIKRTIRPNYAWTQATPKSVFVDPAWNRSVDIFPGMALMKTTGENVTLLDGTGHPYGLAAFYMAPVYGIDEITEQGINAAAVWVLGPDAEFEILDPAFDSTLSWVEPVNGTLSLVYASTAGANRGKLVPSGATNASTRPVARLLKVVSSTKIIVGGLQGTV
jgi:hypothetical protein